MSLTSLEAIFVSQHDLFAYVQGKLAKLRRFTPNFSLSTASRRHDSCIIRSRYAVFDVLLGFATDSICSSRFRPRSELCYLLCLTSLRIFLIFRLLGGSHMGAP